MNPIVEGIMKFAGVSILLFVVVTAFAQRTIQVKPNLEIEASVIGTTVWYSITWTNAPCSYARSSLYDCSGLIEVSVSQFRKLCEYIPRAEFDNTCQCLGGNFERLPSCGVPIVGIDGREDINYGSPWGRIENNEERALHQYELLRQARDKYWDELSTARRQAENFNQRGASTEDDP